MSNADISVHDRDAVWLRLSSRVSGRLTTALLALFVLVFIVAPIMQLFASSLYGADAGTLLQPYFEAFSSPLALSSVKGTLILTGLSLLFGLPLAVLLAWITTTTNAPFGRFLALLPTLSLALSPMVGAVGWLVLLAPNVGIINVVVRSLFGLKQQTGPFNAFSIPVMVMLTSFYVVPYIYGPTAAAFRKLDASVIEAARVCGARTPEILFTVVIPMLRPAILAGALIGGVMAASMFAIPLMLSSGTNFNVIPTQIYHYINNEGRPGPAIAMAAVLTAVTVTAMVFYFRLIGGARFVTVGGKGSRKPEFDLGPWRWLATAFVLVFIFVAMIMPLGTLAYLSLVDFWGSNIFQQSLSLTQYQKLWTFPGAMRGLLNSAWMSALAASIAVAVALIVSYQRLRRGWLVDQSIGFLSTTPLGLPSIVLGLAFLMTFTGGLLPLYGTALILVLAYVVHVLPICARNTDAGLMQTAAELEEAGLVCGASRATILMRIIIPILRHSILAVWCLAFIILFRDLSISAMLYTPATIPSSVALLNIFDQGWMPGTAAYSMIVTAISAGMVALIVWANGRGEVAD